MEGMEMEQRADLPTGRQGAGGIGQRAKSREPLDP
jgi:hypothetical protein